VSKLINRTPKPPLPKTIETREQPIPLVHQ
jgi:hypothetical protein